eukprot:gene10042-2361_t
MDEVLSKKIERVKILEKDIDQTVDLSSIVFLSTDPSHPRASFPYEKYTPFLKKFSKEDFVKEFKIEKLNNEYSFNIPLNVSSSLDGVCVVTKLLQISNSHAGTHVDMPSHFLKNPPFNEWDDFQLNGPCVILNLIHKKNCEIQINDIQEACGSIDLKSITRLLINTYGNDIPTKWDEKPSYLSIECSNYLGTLENLLVLGIDTPSVDHQNSAPICNCSHGGLWSGRIAILENLDFSNLKNDQKVGFMQTIWNNNQKTNDGKGCQVNFFPKK